MMRAVDLFCGAGGFTQGLKNAGISVCLGADNNATAIDVYNANQEDGHGIVHDISDVDGILERIRALAPIDMIVGSSPCQEFSLSGNLHEGVLASLTVDYGRIVSQTYPNVFILENVPNIVNSQAYKTMSANLLAVGYCITVIVMNSKYCGTAQCRRRAFVVGCRGGVEKLQRLQQLVIQSQKRNKALPPVTVRDVLGTDRCGETIYFAPRNRFYPAVLSTNRVYPTLRSHRGKCIERPPAKYKPRYEDAGPVDDAFVMEPIDAAQIASFPKTYRWPCSREKAGTFIGNCVPPAMITVLVSLMEEAGVLDTATTTQVAAVIVGAPRMRKRIESHIEMFWGGRTPLDIGEVITPGPPRQFSYVYGTSPEGDERIAKVLSWTPLPEWRIVFKERIRQLNRVDDTLIYVPGLEVPFRGKRQLVALGLLAP